MVAESLTSLALSWRRIVNTLLKATQLALSRTTDKMPAIEQDVRQSSLARADLDNVMNHDTQGSILMAVKPPHLGIMHQHSPLPLGEGSGVRADPSVRARRAHPHPSPLPEGQGVSHWQNVSFMHKPRTRQDQSTAARGDCKVNSRLAIAIFISPAYEASRTEGVVRCAC